MSTSFACACGSPLGPPRKGWAKRKRVCTSCAKARKAEWSKARRGSPQARERHAANQRRYYDSKKHDGVFRERQALHGQRQRERVRHNPDLHAKALAYSAQYYRAGGWQKLKERRQSPEGREYQRQYMRKYYAARKEELLAAGRAYRQKNKERIALRVKEYYARNRDRFVACARERERKYKRGGGKRQCDLRDVRVLNALQDGCCFWCDRALNGHYHVDHVIPLKHGGAHDRGNMVLACPSCNRRKSAKWPMEFAAELRRMA